jgi:PilZ domain-containing protein
LRSESLSLLQLFAPSLFVLGAVYLVGPLLILPVGRAWPRYLVFAVVWQILYLADGPLGRCLTLMQRFMFLPTHWLSLGLRTSVAIIAPIAFLWTGISPIFDVTAADVLYYFVPMLLALAGGIFAYAPGQLFPLASQVMDTFLAFKILPAVTATIFRPRGHAFKVTPKGGNSGIPAYERGFFWTAAGLMFLTIAGLILNTSPEWSVVKVAHMLPVVAFWSAINLTVLFFVCMMALQAPMRRADERFELNEQISIIGPKGTISTGRIKDLSLSGIGFTSDMEQAFPVRTGERIHVLISEVGFVAGVVARETEQISGVQFNLPPSVERDLLIRKLFTAGLDATEVRTSVWSATVAMLKTSWQTFAEGPMPATQGSSGAVAALSVEKLPPRSLAISPQFQPVHLSNLAEQRRSIAA